MWLSQTFPPSHSAPHFKAVPPEPPPKNTSIIFPLFLTFGIRLITIHISHIASRVMYLNILS